MTTNVPAARVFIYGSCVARDTLEFVERDSVDIRAYIARQSLLSAGNDASAHLPKPLSVSSRFVRRMITRDFAGTLFEDLDSVANDIDVLIWDLADERHGVHRFDDGTVATRSIDNIRVPTIAALLDDAEHLAFGSREHLTLWKRAAKSFTEGLHRSGLLERTLVLEVPWALHTTEGTSTPWSMGMRAIDANRLYAPYYRVLRQLGHTVLEIPQAMAIADPSHRWGLAPFHYVDGVYREVVHALRARGLSTLVEAGETTPN